jgi:hypothetical protein
MDTFRRHWPEYAAEAAALGVFGRAAHPSVSYVVTIPGPQGQLVAFVAEAAMSFGIRCAFGQGMST